MAHATFADKAENPITANRCEDCCGAILGGSILVGFFVPLRRQCGIAGIVSSDGNVTQVQ